MERKRSSVSILVLIGIAAAVFGLTFLILSMTQNAGKTDTAISEEKAIDTLESLYRRITVNTLPPIKEAVDLDAPNVADSLPDISKYPPQVDATTQDYVEIFSSTEKATVSNSGSDTDRWLVDMGDAFNRAGVIVDGKPASVRIRGIASGLGMDYISSGKYVPDAFSPSNELWGDALRAMNIPIALVEKRLTGNVAGLVFSKTKYDELVKKYGSLNLTSVIESVSAGEVIMGYTNPFASSTGANFLISTLYTFDKANPLGADATAAFESFQNNIPFVAYTTLQMKESAKSGSLDGFVFEYQQFMNSPDLKQGYVFTPFGVRHDSPVYELGALSPLKKNILAAFLEFCKQPENQDAATRYGFNGVEDYTPELSQINGEILSQAQTLWKQKKTGTRTLIAVFVADISGSMDGAPLQQLKTSLLSGAKVISPESHIGLVTFSDDVNIALPIGKFDLNQHALFAGAVRNMSAGGGTAMYDAIIVGEKLLADTVQEHPNAKRVLFVLTDGEANIGRTLNDTRAMIQGLRVPIYTIGYNADIAALSAVSSINEAASINADTDDVVYKLSSLLNAET